MEGSDLLERVGGRDGGRAHCPAGGMTLMNGAEMEFLLAVSELAFNSLVQSWER